MKKKQWFYAAIGCVAVSVLSLFASVITFRTPKGDFYNFTIVDLIGQSATFDRVVVHSYIGQATWELTSGVTAGLAVIAVVSIACAVIGLITLRAQRPNTWQFVLTIIGLVGVAFPSLLLLICVVVFGGHYNGTLGFGAAPIITPIAMIICIMVVIRRKNKVAEELRKEMEGKGLIQKAGDL